jgi:hypothetical protein
MCFHEIPVNQDTESFLSSLASLACSLVFSHLSGTNTTFLYMNISSENNKDTAQHERNNRSLCSNQGKSIKESVL